MVALSAFRANILSFSRAGRWRQCHSTQYIADANVCSARNETGRSFSNTYSRHTAAFIAHHHLVVDLQSCQCLKESKPKTKYQENDTDTCCIGIF